MEMSQPSSFISGVGKNPRYERFLGYARPLASGQRTLRLWTPPQPVTPACGAGQRDGGGRGE